MYETPVEFDILFTLFAVSSASNQTIADSDSITVSTGSLGFDMPTTNVSVSGDPTPFVVYYNNPLPRSLTGCTLRLRSVEMGLDETMDIGTIRTGDPMKIQQKLAPPATAIGPQTISASFYSNELQYVFGSQDVEVVA